MSKTYNVGSYLMEIIELHDQPAVVEEEVKKELVPIALNVFFIFLAAFSQGFPCSR